MTVKHVAVVNGSRSCGYSVSKKDGAIVYIFRVYNSIYYSGNLETLTKSKSEAFRDARQDNLTQG